MNIVEESSRLRLGDYLQVNALGEWIIGIYLHELTNNEREISSRRVRYWKFRVHC